MSNLNYFRDIPEQDMGQWLAHTLELFKSWQVMSGMVMTHLTFLAYYARENLGREDIYDALTNFANNTASEIEDENLVEYLRDMTVALPVRGIDYDND